MRRVLRRERLLVAAGRVRFTGKALRELAELDVGFDDRDACRVLAGLTAADAAGRAISRRTGEWMYVFAPEVAGTVLYVKLVLRRDCVVVSFHPEVGDEETEG